MKEERKSLIGETHLCYILRHGQGTGINLGTLETVTHETQEETLCSYLLFI